MNHPSSTYRIQFNSEFTFKDFAGIIGYLHELGVSTVYASPITVSDQGSVHGYDVIDAGQINPEIGTIEELREIAAQLKQHKMKWIQDIVPNHMSFSQANKRLMDVLERGMFSAYYNYFDIDWNHPDLHEQVQIPVLGKELKNCIADGDIVLSFCKKGFQIKYADYAYPLSEKAFSKLLDAMQAQELPTALIEQVEQLSLQSYHCALEEWHQKKEEIVNKITADLTWMPLLHKFLEKVNQDSGFIKEILSMQSYRLAFWQHSESQMNYRRFFTVNTLICLRMEDQSVFDEYHQLFYKLYNEGLIQGVRIDHIDGLYHPQAYVKRLRALLGNECYIIAEKILEGDEDLPRDWDLEGTSGYEFLSFVNRILTSVAGAEKIKNFYTAFTEERMPYENMVFEKKRAYLYSQMRGELQNLMQLLHDLQLTDSSTDLHDLKKALGTFMAAFPRYRIYPAAFPLSEDELIVVNKAIEAALKEEPSLGKEFGFIRGLFEATGNTPLDKKLSFIMRLMQFTGPLAAKGVEDTTFYVYNPLISHNEVGDAPVKLAFTAEEFHVKMLRRSVQYPAALNCTSTHDTKRGEDARMRINVLAHMPDKWENLVTSWHKTNQALRKDVDGKPAPTANDEYFIYQSLLGSFPEDFEVTPEFLERTKLFLLKALREAKVHTTYTEPHEAYEHACVDFAHGILQRDQEFLKTFVPFVKEVIDYAHKYSVGQTVLKSTAPGIPDFYQGSELWDLSYVDPDNRRPVDYELRKQLLITLQDKSQEGYTTLLKFVKDHRSKGAEKMYITHKLLQLRKSLHTFFIKGDYVAVAVSDASVVSYMRSYQNDKIWVVIPVGFDLDSDEYSEAWLAGKTIAPADGIVGTWTNVFTGEIFKFDEALSLSRVLGGLPAAVFKI